MFIRPAVASVQRLDLAAASMRSASQVDARPVGVTVVQVAVLAWCVVMRCMRVQAGASMKVVSVHARWIMTKTFARSSCVADAHV